MERPRANHLTKEVLNSNGDYVTNKNFKKHLYYNGKEYLYKSHYSEDVSDYEQLEVYGLVDTYYSVEESEDGYHEDIDQHIEVSDSDKVYYNLRVSTDKGIINVSYSVGTWGTLYGKYNEETETIDEGSHHKVLSFNYKNECEI